ncbi:uncharacterized protein [Cherax quadricarinatus]|uniref:uncharacterized protein n=1 Tax=Cherax quadricarinatus TaxID=27406 RepID=UPI00387E6178
MTSSGIAMVYCVVSCAQNPNCNFVTYEGGQCMLHTVILATGYNTNATGSSIIPAYRPQSQAVPPLSVTAFTITTTTDFPGFPTFSSSLVQGGSWCWLQVSDCPCTVNSVNQKVSINLGSPQHIRQILVYRTVTAYSILSSQLSIYVGNTSNIAIDPLLYNEQRPFGNQEYSRTYAVGQTARYITFYKNTGANICLCKVLVYN